MKKLLLILFICGLYPAFWTPNIYLTKEGGYAFVLSNKSGATIIKGTVVQACTNSVMCVMPCADEFMAIGVTYSAITNNGVGYIVFSGICDVLMESNTWTTNGNWVYATTNGRANGSIR